MNEQNPSAFVILGVGVKVQVIIWTALVISALERIGCALQMVFKTINFLQNN